MAYYMFSPRVALALSLLITSQALAQREFFIDADTGVDSPSCGDVANPCKTIIYTDLLVINETNAVLRISGHHEIDEPPNPTQRSYGAVPNNGGWSSLIGDVDNPRNVVIDGQDTVFSFIEWHFSDNNQSGPFLFQGITFTGFKWEVVHSWGQHIDVRDCIFDTTGKDGALSIHAETSRYVGDDAVPEEFLDSTTSTIYAENVAIINNNHRSSGPEGRIREAISIYCEHCHNITLVNCTISGSDSALDVAPNVYVRIAKFAHFENVRFLDTRSCAAAGAAFDFVRGVTAAAPLEITLRNVEVRGVTADPRCATDRFGAFYVDDIGGTLDIDGLHVSGATGGRGSALFLQNTVKRASVRNSRFENNMATELGTIYVNIRDSDGELDMEIEDTVFVNNTAGFAGAGIHFQGGPTHTDVKMERVDFIGGTVLDSVAGSGGAFNVRGDNWDITYERGLMVGNGAQFGGAVFVSPSDGTKLTMEHVVVANNTAYSDGGAIYLGGGLERLSRIAFDGNNAEHHGGCLFAKNSVGSSTDVEVHLSEFTGCEATENGGAIYTDGGHVLINGSTIADSVAGNGGGVFHGGHGFLTMTDVKIADNAVGSEGLCAGRHGYGAGVYFDNDACFTSNTLFEDVSFEGNIANLSGGAYFTHSFRCGENWCRDCEFDDNQAAGFGGKSSAPFNEFRSEIDGRYPVTLGERFFLTAIPFDAFGQRMAGNHELISAVIDEEPISPELFLCGERATTASRGQARFALTAYLVDVAGESEIRDVVNAGQDAHVSLYMKRPEGRDFLSNEPDELQLAIVGCPVGYELDLIPRDQVPGVVAECAGAMGGDEGAAVAAEAAATEVAAAEAFPDLLRCEVITTLSADQHLAILTVACITFVAGFMLSLVAFFFRANRVMWSSSLCMLAVTVVGFLALQTGAVLRAFRPTTPSMCMAFEWLYLLGLNVVMGASFAKNLRVWKIFTLKTLSVVDIKNWLLLLGIAVASIPDVITLATQTALFPLTVDTSLRNSTCMSATQGTFRTLFAVFKTLWMVAGIATAYLVRSVPEKFNESKSTLIHVAFTFVTLLVIWGIGDIVTARARTIIEVVTLSLVAFAFLCVVFAPKFFVIYKKRDGTLLSTNNKSGSQATEAFFEASEARTPRGMRTPTNVQSQTENSKSASTFTDESKKEFKARFRRLRQELQTTQKLAERSHENTLELRAKYHAVEADIISIQLEADYRADVEGEEKHELDASDVSRVDRRGSDHSKHVPPAQ